MWESGRSSGSSRLSKSRKNLRPVRLEAQQLNAPPESVPPQENKGIKATCFVPSLSLYCWKNKEMGGSMGHVRSCSLRQAQSHLTHEASTTLWKSRMSRKPRCESRSSICCTWQLRYRLTTFWGMAEMCPVQRLCLFHDPYYLHRDVQKRCRSIPTTAFNREIRPPKFASRPASTLCFFGALYKHSNDSLPRVFRLMTCV